MLLFVRHMYREGNMAIPTVVLISSVAHSAEGTPVEQRLLHNGSGIGEACNRSGRAVFARCYDNLYPPPIVCSKCPFCGVITKVPARLFLACISEGQKNTATCCETLLSKLWVHMATWYVHLFLLISFTKWYNYRYCLESKLLIEPADLQYLKEVYYVWSCGHTTTFLGGNLNKNCHASGFASNFPPPFLKPWWYTLPHMWTAGEKN